MLRHIDDVSLKTKFVEEYTVIYDFENYTEWPEEVPWEYMIERCFNCIHYAIDITLLTKFCFVDIE